VFPSSQLARVHVLGISLHQAPKKPHLLTPTSLKKNRERKTRKNVFGMSRVEICPCFFIDFLNSFHIYLECAVAEISTLRKTNSMFLLHGTQAEG